MVVCVLETAVRSSNVPSEVKLTNYKLFNYIYLQKINNGVPHITVRIHILYRGIAVNGIIIPAKFFIQNKHIVIETKTKHAIKDAFYPTFIPATRINNFIHFLLIFDYSSFGKGLEAFH